MPSPAGPPVGLRLIEVIAAAIAIVVAFLNWDRLDSPPKQVLAVVTLVFLLLAVGRLDVLYGRGDLNWKWFGDLLLIAAPIVLGVALLIFTSTFGLQSKSPSAAVHFIVPPVKTVPRCNVYQGTGAIPPNQRLLIFNRAVNVNGEPMDGGRFYLDGPAVSTEAGWKTPLVEAGAEYVEIAAVLVPNETADFLRSISPVSADGGLIEDGAWLSRSLPFGQKSPSLFVEPDLSDVKPCQ